MIPRRRSAVRTITFAALATVMFLGLAELTLRAAGALYLAAYQRRIAEPVATGSEPLALWAFGDSYTFGVGADDPATQSYPAVAAARLGAVTGRPVQLRNDARPGLNSSEAVDALAAALASGTSPDVVLILVGVNNIRWMGQSGQFCLDEPPPGLELGPLLGLLAHSSAYRALRHVVLGLRPPRDADYACHHIAEGFAQLDDGYPDRAEAAFRAALARNPASRWAQVGIGLARLRVAHHDEAIEHLSAALDAGLAPPALPMALAWSARAAGRVELARRLANRSYPDQLEDFALLLRAWLDLDGGRAGQAEASFARLAGLSQRQDAVPRGGTVPYALDGLGWSLLAQGRGTEAATAFDAANAAGREVSLTPHLLGWSHLGRAQVAIDDGDLDRAAAELELAGRDSSAVASAHALWAWVEGQAGRGGCRSADELIRGALAVVDDQPQALRARRLCADGRQFLPPIDGPEGPAPVRPMPTISVQQWLDPADTRLVIADLRRAVELSRGAGVRLVILTYPQPDAHGPLAEAQRAVAAEADATLVDPRPAMRAALDDGRTWRQLFIPDGHPTTAGYEIIGELVAKALLAQR